MGKKALVKTKKEPNIRRRSNGLWEARKQINGIPIRVTAPIAGREMYSNRLSQR